MTEQVESQVTEQTAEQTVDPHETKARAGGWKPQEEWEGDPDKWYDARTFNMRGEMIHEIKDSRKQINELTNAVKQLYEQQKQAREAGYKQAIDELKQQKKQALLDGDVDRVLELDDKIDEAKQDFKAEAKEAKQDVQGVNPSFVSWVQKNDWYTKDLEMHDFADKAGIFYKQSNPNSSFEDMLEYVESQVKKKFSGNFNEGSKKQVQTVESGGNTGTMRSSKKGLTVSDLSEAERNTMRTMMRVAGLTEQEYLKSLSDTR